MGNIIVQGKKLNTGLNNLELDTDSSKELDTDSNKELDTDSSKELDTDSSKELDTDSSKELDTDSSKELDTDSNKELDSDKILNDALDDQFGTSDKIRCKSEIEDLLKENMILRKTLSILSFFVIGLNVIGFFVLIRP
jgi:hypothetical protein